MAGPSIAYRTLASSSSPRRVGRSVAIRVLVDVLDRVAAGDAWVALVGERGSGRGLAARRLHTHSVRAHGPLVELDAAALSTAPVPAEEALAAATAAVGGSLIVRHAASLSDASLNALRTRDARALLFLAPEDDGWEARPAGAVTVRVPSLRQRRADIPVLIQALLAEHGRDAPRLSAAALERLAGHSWPGNVAELDSVLTLLALRRPGADVTAEDLDGALLPLPEARRLADVERRHILAVLEASQGNRSVAARELGISPRTLYNRLLRYHGHPSVEPVEDG